MFINETRRQSAITLQGRSQQQQSAILLTTRHQQQAIQMATKIFLFEIYRAWHIVTVCLSEP